MYEEIGSRIGMHNDVLDFAIAYGIVGAALCVWAICSVLGLRKYAPKYAVEKYFLTATPVFVALTGLFTGMFQATYVYFMLISTQYYLISQVRVKQALWEQRRLTNDAIWNDALWEAGENDDEEYEDDEASEEAREADASREASAG